MSGINYALRGVASTSALMLGALGQLPVDGLLGYWDFRGALTYFDDKSGNGHHMAPNAQGPHFRYANGLLTADGGGPAVLDTDMQRGAGATANRFTGMAVFRSTKAGQSLLVGDRDGRGVSMIRAGAHAGFVYSASSGGGNNKSGFGPDASGKSYDDFIMYAYACDGERIYLSVDGAAWDGGTAVDPAGVFPLLPGSVLISGDPYSQSAGDYAALGYWSRMLTAAELSSAFRAMQRLTISKGGVL